MIINGCSFFFSAYAKICSTSEYLNGVTLAISPWWTNPPLIESSFLLSTSLTTIFFSLAKAKATLAEPSKSPLLTYRASTVLSPFNASITAFLPRTKSSFTTSLSPYPWVFTLFPLDTYSVLDVSLLFFFFSTFSLLFGFSLFVI